MDNFVDLFMVSPLLLAVLFCCNVSRIYRCLAGGGGLLTVPALLAAGMSPARALATNKLGHAAVRSPRRSISFGVKL